MKEKQGVWRKALAGKGPSPFSAVMKKKLYNISQAE